MAEDETPELDHATVDVVEELSLRRRLTGTGWS